MAKPLSAEVHDELQTTYGLMKRYRRRVVELKEALEQYTNCRHGGVDCFCVREARAALHMVGQTDVERGS